MSTLRIRLHRFAATSLGVAGIGTCHADSSDVDDRHPSGAADAMARRSDPATLVNPTRRERLMLKSSPRMLPLMVSEAGRETTGGRTRSQPK